MGFLRELIWRFAKAHAEAMEHPDESHDQAARDAFRSMCVCMKDHLTDTGMYRYLHRTVPAQAHKMYLNINEIEARKDFAKFVERVIKTVEMWEVEPHA